MRALTLTFHLSPCKIGLQAQLLIQNWHEATRTHAHTQYVPPTLIPQLETHRSSCGGQQMAQAAHFYLLLNIICFIHFALQMYICLLKVACISQLKRSNTPPPPPMPPPFMRRFVQEMFLLCFFLLLGWLVVFGI